MDVKHWSSGERKAMPISEILEYEVSSTHSERGALEDLVERVEKLTKLLGITAESLPLSAQERIVDEVCFYWRLDKV